MDIIKWLKEKLIGNDEAGNDQSRKQSPNLTRQELIDKIYEQFRIELDNESTSVSMLFPTSFYIYLNETDYALREKSFPFTVNDLIEIFYQTIRDKMKRYPGYIPHSRYWMFQFVSFTPGTEIMGPNGDMENLEPKQILVLSSLVPEEIDSNNNDGSRIVTTFHAKDSMTAVGTAINFDSLKGINMLAKDRFKVTFNMPGYHPATNLSKQQMAQASGHTHLDAGTLAVLKVEDGGTFINERGASTTFLMTEDTLLISGRNAATQRGNLSVARLDSEEVLNPHLKIRRESDGRFRISAFGDVRLNEMPLAKDPQKWTLLPNRSAILINGEIQILFKINHNS